MTVSDLVAVNDHQFLMDERDGKGRGDGSVAKVKQIYLVDISGADDVTTISGATNLAPHAITNKTLFLDVKLDLVSHGYLTDQIPAKLEGLSFGPDVVVSGTTEHTLYISNDNDYLASVADDNAVTVDNPNQFFVFAFTDADLPGFLLQPVKALSDDECSTSDQGGGGGRHIF